MKKLNNKGFSLVELIIVIAIMVVLVAVIAPQYLKFVNNSKVSTDVQTASDIATAVNVAVANMEDPFGTGSGTVSKNATAFTAISSLASVKSKYNSSWNFVVTGDNINGVKKIELNNKIIWPDAEISGGYVAAYRK